MKKTILASVFIFSLFLQTTVHAQVPNGGFETWTTTTYHEPTGWTTGNRQSLRRMGVAPVRLVPGFAGSAVRLQTIIAGTDTSDSYITNSNGDPLNGEGGVPFAEQPIGFRAKYRCSLVGSDSAIILIVFKKNGAIVSSDIFKLGGVQSTFATLTFNLSVPIAPDSVIVAMASSDLISGTNVASGSYLEMDNFVFTLASTFLPNYEFESWDTLQYHKPTGWQINGDSISKTTDSYSGSFAIKMVTQDYGGGNVGAAYITTGLNSNQGTNGGLPYTNMVDTLTGYYKYAGSASDSGYMFVSLSHLSTPVGGNSYYFTSAATYTYFQIPLNAGSPPDSMRIDASSSSYPFAPTSVGSTLILDRLGLRSVLVNVENMNQVSSNLITSYPNPAKNILNIGFRKAPTSDFEIIVYNMLGSIVKSERFKSNADHVQLSIADIASGSYYYKFICKDEQLQSSFVKE